MQTIRLIQSLLISFFPARSPRFPCISDHCMNSCQNDRHTSLLPPIGTHFCCLQTQRHASGLSSHAAAAAHPFAPPSLPGTSIPAASAFQQTLRDCSIQSAMLCTAAAPSPVRSTPQQSPLPAPCQAQTPQPKSPAAGPRSSSSSSRKHTSSSRGGRLPARPATAVSCQRPLGCVGWPCGGGCVWHVE